MWLFEAWKLNTVAHARTCSASVWLYTDHPSQPICTWTGHPDTNEMDRRWLHFNDYVIHDYAIAPHPDACVQEYMAWFRSVSHPYVINTDEDNHPVPVPSDARDHETVSTHPEESLSALVCF